MKKAKPVCVSCNSNEALYFTLANGEKLPSYTLRIGIGIFCNSCAKVKA